MKFSLDFDETVTAAPELWKQFVFLARTLGHEVYIVTCRSEEFDNLEEHKVADFAQQFLPEIPVIFTSGHEKDAYCRKYHDLEIDVWIDDNPQWVGKKDPVDWEYPLKQVEA